MNGNHKRLRRERESPREKERVARRRRDKHTGGRSRKRARGRRIYRLPELLRFVGVKHRRSTLMYHRRAEKAQRDACFAAASRQKSAREEDDRRRQETRMSREYLTDLTELRIAVAMDHTIRRSSTEIDANRVWIAALISKNSQTSPED